MESMMSTPTFIGAMIGTFFGAFFSEDISKLDAKLNLFGSTIFRGHIHPVVTIIGYTAIGWGVGLLTERVTC